MKILTHIPKSSDMAKSEFIKLAFDKKRWNVLSLRKIGATWHLVYTIQLNHTTVTSEKKKQFLGSLENFAGCWLYN
jgi:hypothetical protein